MVMQYKSVRVPMETYNIIKVKKVKIEKRIKDLTGQKRSVPITRVIKVLASRSVILFDEDVKKMGRKTKKCAEY